MITLLADKNIPFLSDLLPDGVSLELFDPDRGLPSHNVSVDALFIRTVTPINASTFNPAHFPNVKLIGSASAGIDHVDTAFLRDLGVSFYYAAGCNANAVAEYVVTGILAWSTSKKIDPTKLTVGIVGAGHTGTATEKLLRSVGFHVMLNDPPKELADPLFKGVTKQAVLDANVLTFHVPLVPKGVEFSTQYWLDTVSMAKMRSKLIVNASRGGVVDESALVQAKSAGKHIEFILDVWENEPNLNPVVLKCSYLGTPHIAGYSQQAKFNGTSMIVRELIQFFNLVSMTQEFQSLEIKDAWTPDPQSNDIRNLHPMFGLSDQLKSRITDSDGENINLFKKLRVHSSLRNEYRYINPVNFVVNSPIQKLFQSSGI